MSTLSEEELAWAFGEADGLHNATMPIRWNKLHPELFSIDIDDSIDKTEVKIKAAYAERVIV